MKASKAYIAGLGTTGILLASSVLLMLVVGAVVAFNGGSVSKSLRELEGLVVDRDNPAVLGGPALAASEAAPTAGGVSTRPPASVSAEGAGGAAGAGGAGGAAGAPGTTTPGAGGGRTFGSPQDGGGAGTDTPGAGVSPTAQTAPSQTGTGTGGQTRQGLGGPARGVTHRLGGVVDHVDVGLGGAVRNLGETTGGLLDGLTGGR